MRRAIASAAVLAIAAGIAAATLRESSDPPPPRRVVTSFAERAADDWARPASAKAAWASVGTRCALSRVRGDFDGDGHGDVALVYCRPPESPGRWHVTVLLASGAALHRSLAKHHAPSGSACQARCYAFGAADLDRDGRDELAIELEHGASEWMFGFYRLDRGRIAPVERASGKPLFFGGGGSATHGTGFVCRTGPRGEPLVVDIGYGVTLLHDYAVGETLYAFDGRAFHLRGSRSYGHVPASSLRRPGRRCVRYSGEYIGV